MAIVIKRQGGGTSCSTAKKNPTGLKYGEMACTSSGEIFIGDGNGGVQKAMMKSLYDPDGGLETAGGLKNYFIPKSGNSTISGSLTVQGNVYSEAGGTDTSRTGAQKNDRRVYLYATSNGLGLKIQNSTYSDKDIFITDASGNANGNFSAITLDKDPTAAMQAATKQYVDNAITNALKGYLKVSSFSNGTLNTTAT